VCYPVRTLIFIFLFCGRMMHTAHKEMSGVRREMILNSAGGTSVLIDVVERKIVP